MTSIIGQLRKDDNLPIHDRTHGRGDAQDFIVRIRGGTVETQPLMDEETFKCVKQAINMAESHGTPWVGTVNDLRIQIHSIIR